MFVERILPRMSFGCLSTVCLSIVLALGCLGGVLTAADRPNVLFIAVDDLRPELNCYGRTHMHTPHMDELARRGVLMERAYCMVPTCGASRAALMTGIRPARGRFVNYLTWAEKDAPGITTLNTHFRQNGYRTVSVGKIFHHTRDSADGWTDVPWRPAASEYQDEPARQRATQENRRRYPGKNKHRGPAFEAFDAPDEKYRDAMNASKAIEYLDEMARNPEQPFFLAVGFFKPHLPFVAPKKYWDLYDRDVIDLPSNSGRPRQAPQISYHNSGELRAYAGIPAQGDVDRETAKSLIHGYYACVSFTDAQVGRLLQALGRLDLADNTIIVLWGDHGWQLGEHGMWNKHSCYETSMHAPLIVVAPTESEVRAGSRVHGLCEFIDIYPTLCQLTSLPLPAHLQGTSLVPQLKNPQLPGKEFAIGRYRTGDTIRTDKWRFTEYAGAGGRVNDRMLYDHERDARETVNVAEQHQQQASSLSQTLNKHKGQ